MDEALPWQFEEATVRPERADDLRALVQMLFQRRSLPHLTGWAKTWQVKELGRDLKAASTVYAAASTDGSPAPFPFALAHLRIRNGRLEPIADAVVVEDPALLARILSEFLKPGAAVQFGTGAEAQRWTVTGIGEIARVPVSAASADVSGDT
ncbi:MAG: hypothetical protein GVY12_02730 [Bacteroidetes bacterium]|jgi:hypothetical protein|nr:hypothetical protein [Bacteroidota bacterium]